MAQKTPGETIRYWRKKYRLSASELGRRVGIMSGTNMGAFERGDKNIGLKKLIEIARVLEVSEEPFIQAYFADQLAKIEEDQNFEISVKSR